MLIDWRCKNRSFASRDFHRKAVALFERVGELHPPEITEFPISKLPEALKCMTRAAYRGKIVLNMQNERVRTLPPRNATFRPDRCYLISGGASGVGLEIARWMVGSRRAPSGFVQPQWVQDGTLQIKRAVEAMMQQGRSSPRHAKGCDRPGMTSEALIERIKTTKPPLAGVIHSLPAVLDDASLAMMTPKRFENVFGPKAQGAWNLHEATLAAGANLDFFLMLSSISSVLGLYGQVNYAAANYFQDALAQYRQQRGLTATSVNLGVLGQYAGMSRAANDGRDVLGLLESHGMLVMPLTDVLAKLEAALVQRKPAQRMMARLDWSRFRTAYPHLVRDSRFLELLSDAALARGTRPKGANLPFASWLEPRAGKCGVTVWSTK